MKGESHTNQDSDQEEDIPDKEEDDEEEEMVNDVVEQTDRSETDPTEAVGSA